MNKEDIIDIMIDAFQEKNLSLASTSGMSDDEAKSQIEAMRGTIGYLLESVYDALILKNLLKND